MTTDLFAVASSLDPGAVLAAVPPECRRGVEPPPAAGHLACGDAALEHGNLVLEFGPWVSRSPSRHFVPVLSVLGTVDYSVRFELAIETDGRWSPWVASATLGGARFPHLPSACDALACDIDVFVTPSPAEQVRLRVRLAAVDPRAVLEAPWLVTLSASDLAPAECAPVGVRSIDGVTTDARASAVSTSAAIPVPAWSQMEEAEAIRLRICSPTSVAMVLAHFGRPVPPAVVAAGVLHPALDRYGVWPAAIRAAGMSGVPGYLLRFPSWSAAAWCLTSGLPIVASLRWSKGELTGSPLPETDGHLMVLTGYDGDDVLVNDPVAPTRAEVPRRYRLAEVRRAWLDRSGVGYVFFRPRDETVAD